MRRFLFPVLILSLALAACEGARNNTSWSQADTDAKIVPSLEKPVHAQTDTSAAGDSTQVHH